MTTVPWTAEPSDLDDLDGIDDLDETVPGRPLRRRLGKSTAVLAALALAAIAFFGGVTVEKRHAKTGSPSTANLAALAARFRAAAAGGGLPGAPSGPTGAGGGAITGTIALIDGSNIYVTQSDGSIVKAVTSAGSQITVTSAGTVTSLHPGDSVTVTGPAGANGDVTATAIRDNGAGGGRRAAGG